MLAIKPLTGKLHAPDAYFEAHSTTIFGLFLKLFVIYSEQDAQCRKRMRDRPRLNLFCFPVA